DDRLAGTRGHFEGHSWQTGVRGIVRLSNDVLDPCIAVFFGDFRNIYGRFEGFDLTEEEPLFPASIGPIFQQPCRGRRYSDMATVSPLADTATNIVDQLVLFNSILRPLRVQDALLCPLFFLRLSDGHKVRTGPAALVDFVRYPLVGKSKMPGRLV